MITNAKTTKTRVVEEETVEEEKHVEREVVQPPERDDEEMRRARLGRRPVLPTKAEVTEHYPLHLNYRSLCKHCVAGKSQTCTTYGC